MPWTGSIRWLWLLLAASLVGCAAQNGQPGLLTSWQQRMSGYQQPPAVAQAGAMPGAPPANPVAGLYQRSQELQTRASSLDTDNQELERMLAQSRQETRVLQDQVGAMREQLRVATQSAAQMRAETQDTTRRAEALTASLNRRAGASITANNSLQTNLSKINIPGVETRVDGDVLRIELPGSRLFDPGTARLSPQAIATIDAVAAEVMRSYPTQMIGVEGHTDSDPVPPGHWSSNQHLSIGRAMAVYDQLQTRGRIPPHHLFVVGHGTNHPVVSNGTPAGKQRNNRVELVIYPDRAPGI